MYAATRRLTQFYIMFEVKIFVNKKLVVRVTRQLRNRPDGPNGRGDPSPCIILSLCVAGGWYLPPG